MLNILIKFANSGIAALGEFIGVIMLLFPNSPFLEPARPPNSINLGYITWLIPFPQMIQHFALLLTCIGVYYLVRVAARWVKLVRE